MGNGTPGGRLSTHDNVIIVVRQGSVRGSMLSVLEINPVQL